MTLKGGSSQACAACKYQRKRCTPECALAPHFRPEQAEVFKNAHKLFGVRNILRILEQIDPSQKTNAMRSIIYQANMRERFPVHGCLGVIYHLQYDIRQAEEELYAVLSQLAFYKHHHRRQQEPVHSKESHQLQLGIGVKQPSKSNAPITFVQHEATGTPQRQLNPVTVLSKKGDYCNHVVYSDSKDNENVGNTFWAQQTCGNNDNDNKALTSLQSQLTNSNTLTIQGYKKIHPFFEAIDDSQPYIKSKEANESSSEPSQRNELKSAELQLGIISEEY